jgi:hypothetical protein
MKAIRLMNIFQSFLPRAILWPRSRDRAKQHSMRAFWAARHHSCLIHSLKSDIRVFSKYRWKILKNQTYLRKKGLWFNTKNGISHTNRSQKIPKNILMVA